MTRAKRRKFTTEFKNETVKLIRESNRSVGEICRELDLTETAVRRWLKQADVDDGVIAIGLKEFFKRSGSHDDDSPRRPRCHLCAGCIASSPAAAVR